MIRTSVFLLGIVLLPLGLRGQNNLVTNYNPHWSLLASRQLPSALGLDNAQVQVSVVSPHVYGGNTAIGYGSAHNLTTSEINAVINKLRPRNNAGAGIDLDWLAVGITVNRADREPITLSVMATERTAANLVFTDNLARLVWRGNKQFAGQRVDLGPLALNYVYFREYALGAAAPVGLGLPESFSARLGGRLKFLQGFAAMHMPKANVALFTEQDGRYLEFDMDYKINTAFKEKVDVLNILNAPLGGGLGTDLGLTVQHKNRFSGSFSLLDLGFISYNKNTATHTIRDTVRYEGVEVDELFDNADFDIDSDFANTIKGDKTEGRKFTMPTSARFMLQCEYKIPAMTTKNRPYKRTAIYLTYIQGVTNLPGSTTRPFFSAGFAQSFANVLNLGTSLAYGGYNRLAIGAFGSVRMGALRVGAGSSNVTYLLSRNSSTGADFSLNMTWAFGEGTAAPSPFPE